MRASWSMGRPTCSSPIILDRHSTLDKPLKPRLPHVWIFRHGRPQSSIIQSACYTIGETRTPELDGIPGLDFETWDRARAFPIPYPLFPSHLPPIPAPPIPAPPPTTEPRSAHAPPSPAPVAASSPPQAQPAPWLSLCLLPAPVSSAQRQAPPSTSQPACPPTTAVAPRRPPALRRPCALRRPGTPFFPGSPVCFSSCCLFSLPPCFHSASAVNQPSFRHFRPRSTNPRARGKAACAAIPLRDRC